MFDGNVQENTNLYQVEMFPDISNFNNTSDVYLLAFAILTVDVIVMFFARYFPQIFGEDLNKWYDDFHINAVLSDVTIILIGFQLARYVYTFWIEPTYGWNPLIFVGLLVCIQAIHDILFYVYVIQPLPQGHNQMIDRLKSYSRGGFKIIGGDAILMILSAMVAFFYKSQPEHITMFCSVLVLYTLPYILYTKKTSSSLLPSSYSRYN
jgi:hypothetical protein